MTPSHAVFESLCASVDVPLSTDPNSAFWLPAPGVFAEADLSGEIRPEFRLEARSRWTPTSLYFLFICPYRKLNLNPHPRTDQETNRLWDWDVAEIFIGSDFNNINRYKEFEVSPQAEWVDLDIDLAKPNPADGWVWQSGMEVAARVDSVASRWYACMKIPYPSVDRRRPRPGNHLRANFFLSAGTAKTPVRIQWQPTGANTFHVPQVFGALVLAGLPDAI